METAWDDWSTAVGWPLVKALDQFGSFSGVKPLSEKCPNTLPTPVPTVFTQTPPGAQLDIITAGCCTPGLDFSHAALAQNARPAGTSELAREPDHAASYRTRPSISA